jgi:hypothetical protein
MVFGRLHGLGALVQRLEFELTIQGFNEMSIVEIHRSMVAELGRWLEAEGLQPFLTEPERGLLTIPLGHWNPDLLEAVGWRVESLGVLAWALSLTKTMPPYDRRFGRDELLMRLQTGKPLQPHRDAARLRPADELRKAMKAAALWEWRAHTARLLDTTEERPDESTLPAFIESQARTGLAQGLLPEPIDGDFPAFGRPYRALSDEQAVLVATIAKERAEALRWLCGQGS